MEIPNHINSFFSKSENHVLRADHDFLEDLSYYKKKFVSIGKIIDKLGKKSSKAQGLGQTITTFSKLRITKYVIYLCSKKDKKTGKYVCCGMLKVGKKKLFIRDFVGEYHELFPLCVLDFYVHESWQRKGVGKLLFTTMLQYEKCEAEEIGYDRPSIKLKRFLKKHYGLSDYIVQTNNFVVFNKYFEKKLKRELISDSYMYKSVSHSPLKVDENVEKLKKNLFFSKKNIGSKGN